MEFLEGSGSTLVYCLCVGAVRGGHEEKNTWKRSLMNDACPHTAGNTAESVPLSLSLSLKEKLAHLS